MTLFINQGKNSNIHMEAQKTLIVQSNLELQEQPPQMTELQPSIEWGTNLEMIPRPISTQMMPNTSVQTTLWRKHSFFNIYC